MGRVTRSSTSWADGPRIGDKDIDHGNDDLRVLFPGNDHDGKYAQEQ